MDRQRLTVTDYVVRADGNVVEVKPTLREARLFIKDMGKTGQVPNVVELLKRTTTQWVMNVYVPKQVETLVSASGLDEGLE